MRFRLIWKFHLIIDMVKMLKDIMALADFGEGGGLGAFPEPWECRLQFFQNRERVGIGIPWIDSYPEYWECLNPLASMKALIFDHALL